MAWTTMHYGVGMGCAGVIFGTGCLIFRRGWRWIPAAMTAGGIWGMVPDLPRIFREDFPNLPGSAVFGSKTLERGLHNWGDLFFFHKHLDSQPQEFALLGLGLILALYNVSILLLMILEHQQRNSTIHRAWKAHDKRTRHRRMQSRRDTTATADEPSQPLEGLPATMMPTIRTALDDGDPVIARIGADRPTGST